jgi:hypothetical protein
MKKTQDAANAPLPASASTTPSDELAAYREQYPAKPMQRDADNTDQLILMKSEDGVFELPSPPAQSSEFSRITTVPKTRDDAIANRHLWVILPGDVPVALEACEWGKKLESGCIKHSNLTGGADAHSGGELWFTGDDHIAINAASGRYGAQSEQEFDLIVDALRRSGYHVASTGFDVDNISVPNRVFAGEPDWQEPL